MSTFPRTRAAAASIARHTPGEPARARAAALLAILRVLDSIPVGSGAPAACHAMLRERGRGRQVRAAAQARTPHVTKPS